jgi:hypothetical protein
MPHQFCLLFPVAAICITHIVLPASISQSLARATVERTARITAQPDHLAACRHLRAMDAFLTALKDKFSASEPLSPVYLACFVLLAVFNLFFILSRERRLHCVFAVSEIWSQNPFVSYRPAVELRFRRVSLFALFCDPCCRGAWDFAWCHARCWQM